MDKGYKKLIAWQKADELAFQVYLTSKNFPKEEIYGITSQLRRAAISIPTNIAEGMGRQNRNETRQFINIALGSATEVEYLLSFCLRLDLLTQDSYKALDSRRQDASNLLFGLYKSL